MVENNNHNNYAVLFVDDEDKALKYFSKAFADRFHVFTAGDVDTAEEILEANRDRIAVVISDQRMPGRNGVELLKNVRTQYPATVRLLTTAYSDVNDAIEAINRGEIYRYIKKPWNLEMLRSEVTEAVELFALQRERDLLLGEKLSARQRMVGIERISQLISIARLQDILPHADRGMKDFLDQLHALPGAWEFDSLGRTGHWELTKWETKRTTDFIRAVENRIFCGNCSDTSREVVTTAALMNMNRRLAGDLDIDLSYHQFDSPAVEWLSNRGLLENLMRNAIDLCSELRQDGGPIEMRLFLSRGPENIPGEKITVAFRVEGVDWPGDRHLLLGSAMTSVHPVYEQALTCVMIAAQHGGRCALELGDNDMEVRLSLPLARDDASLSASELGWEWLPEVLSRYEPQIDEFYHDL